MNTFLLYRERQVLLIYEQQQMQRYFATTELPKRHPMNTRTCIQCSTNWDACPLIAVHTCIPINIELWPAVPFNIQECNEDGACNKMEKNGKDCTLSKKW